MAYKAPYLPYDELRRRAEAFLERHNPHGTIPVRIEAIVEFDFGIDIVPTPGLQDAFEIVGYISKDLQSIYVDSYVFEHREKRYRFSLAHELGHRLLHADLFEQLSFSSVAEWKHVMHNAIPEREYGYLEFHANSFAGLVLAPPTELRVRFLEIVARVKASGVSPNSEAATELIPEYVGNIFNVSADVIRKRLDKDGLWKEVL